MCNEKLSDSVLTSLEHATAEDVKLSSPTELQRIEKGDVNPHVREKTPECFKRRTSILLLSVEPALLYFACFVSSALCAQCTNTWLFRVQYVVL